jgi:hypothetical protein
VGEDPSTEQARERLPPAPVARPRPARSTRAAWRAQHWSMLVPAHTPLSGNSGGSPAGMRGTNRFLHDSTQASEGSSGFE